MCVCVYVYVCAPVYSRRRVSSPGIHAIPCKYEEVNVDFGLQYEVGYVMQALGGLSRIGSAGLSYVEVALPRRYKSTAERRSILKSARYRPLR